MSDDFHDDPVRNPYTSPESVGSINNPRFQNGPGTIAASVLTGQLIVASLAMGLIVISAILTFVTLDDANDVDLLAVNEDSMLFLMLGFAVCFGSIVIGAVIRMFVMRGAVTMWAMEDPNVEIPLSLDKEFDGSKSVLGAMSAANLIGAAMIEGPGVLNAILIMVNSNMLHLIPVGIAVIGILLMLPTNSRVRNKLESAIGSKR